MTLRAFQRPLGSPLSSKARMPGFVKWNNFKGATAAHCTTQPHTMVSASHMSPCSWAALDVCGGPPPEDSHKAVRTWVLPPRFPRVELLSPQDPGRGWPWGQDLVEPCGLSCLTTPGWQRQFQSCRVAVQAGPNPSQ